MNIYNKIDKNNYFKIILDNIESENIEKAQKMLEQWGNLYDNCFLYFNGLGLVNMKLNNIEEAKKNFKKSINLKKEQHPSSYIHLLEIYENQKKKKEENKILEKIFLMKNEKFYLELANHYVFNNNLSQAEINYEKAIKYSKIKITNEIYLAYLYTLLEQKKLKKAKEFIEKLKKNSPYIHNDISIKIFESKLYLDLKNYNEGTIVLDELILKNIDVGFNYYNKGLLEFYIQNYEKALEHFNKAISYEDKDEDIYYMIGFTEEKLENYKEAIINYKKAIKTNINLDALNNMAICKDRIGLNEEAINDLNRLIEINPKYENAHVNKIALLLDSERINEALDHITKHKNNFSNKELKLFTDAIIQANLGKVNEAIKSFEKIRTSKNKILDYSFSNNYNYYYSKLLIDNLDNNLDNKTKTEIIKKIIELKGYHYIDLYQKLENIEDELISEFILKIKINLLKEIKEELKKRKKFFNYNKIGFYRYSNILKKDSQNNFELNDDKLTDLKNCNIKKSNPKFFNDPFDPYYKIFDFKILDELEKIKMTCFSSEKDNLLLWAHYADNHKGICVKYKVPLNSKDIYIDKIIYNTIYSDECRDSSFKKITFSETLFRKHEDWSYEKEFRVIYFNLEENTFKYEIEEIIFGLKFPDNFINEFILKIGNKNIKYSKMTKAEGLRIKQINL